MNSFAPYPADRRARGVALVAVLSVLTVLAVLSAAFATLLSIDVLQAKESQHNLQLDLLTRSANAHAHALLWDAYQRGTLATLWSRHNSHLSNQWFYVTSPLGELHGRYRLCLEDESSKVNLNVAWLTHPSPGSGWHPGELNLASALGLRPEMAQRLVAFRYGPNGVPGARGDDDQNNVRLMNDGIDNNANGIIDEENEGVEDPGEYSITSPRGDDRRFSSIIEAVGVMLNTPLRLPLQARRAVRREIPRRATLYSTDFPGSPTLPSAQRDINTITGRECRRMLSTANTRRPFVGRTAMADQLAANIIDYRDENHVLSTVGQAYGVEAICFSEMLANDASYCIHPDLGASTPGFSEPTRDQWRARYGSSDGKRLLYRVDTVFNCVPDDPMMPSGEYYYNLDPREAWRVAATNAITSGRLTVLDNNTIRIQWPNVPGPSGSGHPQLSAYNTLRPPATLPGGRPWCNWPSSGSRVHVFGTDQHYTRFYNDLMDVLRKINMSVGNRPRLPNNYFRNAHAMIYAWGKERSDAPSAIGCFEIIASDSESITFRNRDANTPASSFLTRLAAAGMSPTSYDLSVTINAWGNRTAIACLPRTCQMYLMRAREPVANRYYQVVIGRPQRGRFTNGYPDDLGVSGKVDGPYASDTDLTREWWYNDGEPVRTKSGGWLTLLIQSSKEVARAGDRRQLLSYFRLIAPEVVEMYNASMTPVSLANWRVICNTGSLATEIGRIERTSYYDRRAGRSVLNNNPVIAPGGHFYLVNDTKLFDCWYGNADGMWGTAHSEEIPVFQMDKRNWGITYRISRTRVDYPPSGRAGYVFFLQEANLDTKIFDLETVRIIDEEHAKDPYSWHNIFAPVKADEIRARNEIFIEPIGDDRTILNQSLVGKSIMVLGLPHKGGIVSLTLKNEYDQVCARTVDYGKIEASQLNYTSQRSDPTKLRWTISPHPTISGLNRLALNRAARARGERAYQIKNAPYGSVGELRHVSAFDDFERLGDNPVRIAAIADVASCAHLRLEAAAADVIRNGWRVACDEVADARAGTIIASKGGWEPGQWKGHTVRFLTGPMRGQRFPVFDNTSRSLLLQERGSTQQPLSAPSGLPLRPLRGDLFTVGPGYATPLCFTRRAGEQGEWHWKNVPPLPTTCNLYLYGLSDSIRTTEFLEENHNAALDVEVWNFRTEQYDRLCQRRQYGKQDSFLAGKIRPEHVSAAGDFKLRLTAHGVVERAPTPTSSPRAARGTTIRRASDVLQSGFAWFNFAVISPVAVPGRINVNTASERVLASVPGITPQLAHDIACGINRGGSPTLKPYRALGDLLFVRGMSPEIFERCANLFAVDTSAVSIDTETQLLKSRPSGVSDTEAFVVGSRHLRSVVQLRPSADRGLQFNVAESYSP
ncbi:MAG: helix-hairpin-helix domain-containing protein [bacterium]|nr:helix-hairpin-helix domain-containing protein [bacterium]